MADEQVKIDKDVFHDRLSGFIAAWKNDRRSGDAIFSGAASMAIVMGKADEGAGYQKNSAFHFWTLGYEFPATLVLITSETVYFVTTKKKAEYLESLKGGKVQIEILVRGKDTEENTKIWDRILDAIKNAGNKLGILSKVKLIGPFSDEWKTKFATISDDVKEVDISGALSHSALAIKDEKELRATREAARTSSNLLMKFFVDEMSGILDEEKKVTHKALADKVEKKLDDSKYIQKELGVEKGFDVNQLDWAFIPSVQSGGTYDLSLKHDMQSSSENLHAGTIIASLGFRYMFYSALVARTYLVDPVKSQESNYKLLLSIHDAIIKESREGTTVRSLYKTAIDMVKAKKPELEGNFLKSVGFGIGMETKDDTLLLDAKNERTLRDGMTLTITTGFKDLTNDKPQDKKSKTYALLIADTIRVTSAGAVVFTKDAPSDLGSTSFFFKESEDEAAPQKSNKPKKDSRIGAVATANIQKTRLRAERATMADAEKDAQRRVHQKEVHDKKQAQGVQKYSRDTGALNGVEEKKFKRFESYKRDNQFPNRAKLLEICVDERNQTVVLPIMGRPVPFHINTIKNASRTEEQGYSFLRINFLSPGQGVGRKDDQPFEDPEAHFVRSLTFRSKDISRMADITDQITDLKKASVRREQEKKEMEDVVEQDKLIENRNRKNVPILPGVYIRPGLEGKRVSGNLEVHQNGIRYTHGNTGVKVDVLFSNVKHLFFQPSEQELIVIIHLTLIDPIMLGKKKTKEVQFIQEALANTIDETGNKKRKQRYGDEEEFEQEQEERRRRAETNRTFKKFADLIADAARQENLAVDVPFVELGFQGVPARSSVLVTPTTDCLVQLTEPPFLCVTLSDIEIVHLERVQFGLKNFDMVIVFSDFNRTPMHINTIPVENLDPVKDWLDSVDIPFSQGPLNLNWTPIMKTIQANPYEFFKGGGWDFLNEESDDEGSAESEEESAFEMSDSEVAELSDEESEASDFDDDASADGDSGDASLDESEDGEDWDELEKKAERKDRETNLDDSGDDRKSSKSKPKAKAAGSKKR